MSSQKSLDLKSLKIHKYQGDGNLKAIDISKYIDKSALEMIGQGLHTRAYKIAGTDWILKEGRWDIDMPVFENFKVSIPLELAESFLNIFSFYYLPKEETIKRQFQEYQLLREYLAFDQEDINGQGDHKTRKLLDDPELFDFLSTKQFQLWQSILADSDVYKTNFLPEEYLFYGKPISGTLVEKNTYFILQKFIEGEHLIDVQTEDIRTELIKKLLLLAGLVNLMAKRDHVLPDFRPKMYLIDIEWFEHTENVIVNDDSVMMIDTRWLWDFDGNLVKRGILIPEAISNSVKNFMKKNLNLLLKSK